MYFNRYVVNYSVIKKPTLRFMSLTILVCVQRIRLQMNYGFRFIPLTILVGVRQDQDIISRGECFIPLTILVGVQQF